MRTAEEIFERYKYLMEEVNHKKDYYYELLMIQKNKYENMKTRRHTRDDPVLSRISDKYNTIRSEWFEYAISKREEMLDMRVPSKYITFLKSFPQVYNKMRKLYNPDRTIEQTKAMFHDDAFRTSLYAISLDVLDEHGKKNALDFKDRSFRRGLFEEQCSAVVDTFDNREFKDNKIPITFKLLNTTKPVGCTDFRILFSIREINEIYDNRNILEGIDLNNYRCLEATDEEKKIIANLKGEDACDVSDDYEDENQDELEGGAEVVILGADQQVDDERLWYDDYDDYYDDGFYLE